MGIRFLLSTIDSLIRPWRDHFQSCRFPRLQHESAVSFLRLTASKYLVALEALEVVWRARQCNKCNPVEAAIRFGVGVQGPKLGSEIPGRPFGSAGPLSMITVSCSWFNIETLLFRDHVLKYVV